MIELKNILCNNRIIFIFACFILFLFFIIFFLKWKIEKESNLIKRINKRFLLKYMIFCMLIMGMILVVTGYVLAFIFKEIGNYVIYYAFAFLLVSVEWAFLFDKLNIYTALSKYDILNQYILFFAKSKISNTKYIEIITWFSRWNHKNFRLKNDYEQEVDKVITKLELLLRPNDNGFCLASRHKNTFLKLCAKLEKCETEEKMKEIENAVNEMEKNLPEKYRFFSLGLDHNILIYLSIIAFHISASILISDNIKNIIGNILFYIPSDILVILVYKGIINEREKNEK